jgi:uncharacterized coiled-coil protein SlyX
MSAIGDALKAIKKAIWLEERIASQSKKLEQLAFNVVEMDKRLAALEGRMDGFLAAASAFRGADRPAKAGESKQRGQLLPPPDKV